MNRANKLVWYHHTIRTEKQPSKISVKQNRKKKKFPEQTHNVAGRRKSPTMSYLVRRCARACQAAWLRSAVDRLRESSACELAVGYMCVVRCKRAAAASDKTASTRPSGVSRKNATMKNNNYSQFSNGVALSSRTLVKSILYKLY